MPLNQSIDSALEKTIGAARRVRRRAEPMRLPAPRARSTGCGSITPRARCRCCACPRTHDDLAAHHATPPRRLGEGATDIVILGTGGSSLGGQTLAQLAGYRRARRRRLARAAAHAFHRQSRSGLVRAHAREAAARDQRASSPSPNPAAPPRRLMQTIAALVGGQGGPALDPRERFLGISEPAKPGKRNGLRDLLGKHQVPMLDHDPGVGGRFSVLTNVGLLPAAMLGLDIARDPPGRRPMRWRRCWRRRAGRGAGRARRGARGRARRTKARPSAC